MKKNEYGNITEKERRERVITLNKKAFHDYEISNKYEAGIVLTGTEIKTLRQQKGSIQEAYARVKKGEVWLIGSNIPEYKYGTFSNHEPLRDRKLLLHNNEIKKITTKLQDKGFTLVPLKLYFSGPYVKIELGLARGKRSYDKREAIKKEEVKRQLKRIKHSF
ncbi:MAG: SsrA-binding protein SmpB [Ignavibacteriae bacterium]|nr:MAG: SsrA-binding protein SmpB [Ignavibacteriota bacterium]